MLGFFPADDLPSFFQFLLVLGDFALHSASEIRLQLDSGQVTDLQNFLVCFQSTIRVIVYLHREVLKLLADSEKIAQHYTLQNSACFCQ